MTAIERAPCTGGEPPFCCQPPMTDAEWEARGARIAAIQQASRDRYPSRCPACSSTWVQRLGWGDFDGYGCLECGRVFFMGD